jgi:3-hydroxybutyryl-CoA dehydrogenase
MLERIGVVGAGTMGAGIALTALQAGLQVVLYDVSPDALSRARDYAEKHLAKKGKIEALQNLTLSSDLAGLSDAQVVIEAALEDLNVKQDIFAQLERLCPASTILATNTSTLSITAIAGKLNHPARFAGMHFFNPAPVLPLVEVVRGMQTSQETVDALVELAKHMGKTPVVAKDTPGFIVNRCARPFYLEALRILEEGIATVEQIDLIMQLGGGFKMGPFRLMDLIGLDISLAATQSVYEQTFHEPRYRPSRIQAQMVAAGLLGRKTGKGFYDYTQGDLPPLPTPPDMKQNNGEIIVLGSNPFTQILERAGYRIVKHSDLPVAAFDFDYTLSENEIPEGVPIFIIGISNNVITSSLFNFTHPQRIIGYDHLFTNNVITLVKTPLLSGQIQDKADAFIRSLGRIPVWVKSAPGLILPRIMSQLTNEAGFMIGEGIADEETINIAQKLALNYPYGVLDLENTTLDARQVISVLRKLKGFYDEERYRIAPYLKYRKSLDNASNRNTDD